MPDTMIPQMPGAMPLNAPQAAPMSAPGPKEGLQARARIEIQQAIQVLKKNLNPEVFEVHGQEWKALDSSIRSLSKVIGEEQGKELSNAGLKQFAAAQGMPKGLAGLMGGDQPQGMPAAPPMPMALGGM